MRTDFIMTIQKANPATNLVSRSLFPGNENGFSDEYSQQREVSRSLFPGNENGFFNDYSQGEHYCHHCKSFSFPWK